MRLEMLVVWYLKKDLDMDEMDSEGILIHNSVKPVERYANNPSTPDRKRFGKGKTGIYIGLL